MRRAWVMGLVALGVAAAGTAAVSIAGPPAATPQPLNVALPACLDLVEARAAQTPGFWQPSAGDPALQCLQGALVDAVDTGTFSQIGALGATLAQSSANGACHGAAHVAGLKVGERYRMHEALALMFPPGTVQTAEPVCGTGVVHGLVQAEVSDEPPYDLEYIADQCRALASVDVGYSSECAHYFGHAVYKHVGSLDPQLGVECGRLQGVADGWAEESCMSGAVMQKYRLQDRSYGNFMEDAPMGPPPPFEELESLCSVFTGMRSETIAGCWSGVGWLMSQKTEQVITESGADPGTPEGREAIASAYVNALARCADLACAAGIFTHFRMDMYSNGVAAAVCSDPALTPRLPQAQARGICENMIRIRTGEVSSPAS